MKAVIRHALEKERVFLRSTLDILKFDSSREYQRYKILCLDTAIKCIDEGKPIPYEMRN